MKNEWLSINGSYHGISGSVGVTVSESAEGWSWRISVENGAKQTWGRFFKTAEEAMHDFDRIAAAFN